MPSTPNRRTFCLGSAAALSAGMFGRGAFAQDMSLSRIAESRGLFFGTAAEAVVADDMPDMAELINREAGCLVPEWSMKWAHLQPEPDLYQFDEADAIFDLAAINGQWMRGHCIIWHESVPDWALEQMNVTADWDRLITPYIVASANRYGRRLRHWDVVNEALDHDTSDATGLKATPFFKMLGDDYVPLAFQQARAATSAPKLFYNDYGFSGDSDWMKRRRLLALRALERWLGKGAPIDGFGIQSHLFTDDLFDEKAFRTFLREVADMGLEIVLSELDVRETQFDASGAVRAQAVADRVRHYLDVALDERAVSGVVCWGLSSRTSWLQDFHDPRNLGNPYDANMQPTSMRSAIAKSLANTPERRAA